MSVPQEETTKSVLSPSEFFQSIGQQADKVAPTTNGTATDDDAADDDQKVVEEIESLCMNCHENVCLPLALCTALSELF